jgi:hypothetical protein
MGEKKVNLYDLLVELSGLDRNVIDKELGAFIEELSLDPSNLSTDDIRRIATLYLFEFQSNKEGDLSEFGEHNHKITEFLCEAEA